MSDLGGAVTIWETGQRHFNADRLSDVLERITRYHLAAVNIFRRTTLLVALVVLFNAVAHAADEQSLFNIAAGPLQRALERLAAQSGLQLLYDPALLQGRTTRDVVGSMTPRKALAAVLADSDITFNFTASDAVALLRKPKPPLLLPSLGDYDRPRTITISTNRTLADLYNAPTRVTATKVDESLLNVPLASEALTAGVLRDLHHDGFRDTSGNHRIFLAPVMTWNLSARVRGGRFSDRRGYRPVLARGPGFQHVELHRGTMGPVPAEECRAGRRLRRQALRCTPARRQRLGVIPH